MEERFRTFALSVARDIVSDAKETANGVVWLADDMFGVGGDARTLAWCFRNHYRRYVNYSCMCDNKG